jgi:hypothetical protein
LNFPDALPETGDLLRAVVARHGVQVSASRERPLHSANISALIEPMFGRTETFEHPNALIYPDADAFARYAIAMLSFYGVDQAFPQRDAVVDDLITEAHRRVDAHDGRLREEKGFAVSLARR